ncbi:SusC/RagA family TonB-linked outer membrane protein [Anaerophaga thermohalophila]|uniref:SusC/RagA family TonB-linked outer membrane protein n=1 Tax=Anaerophaga thermohalophila TaxID=177400 RepID=UPI0004922845|nr:TonB-dependent receptor [Anaerophaga thermohalophila]
MKNRMFKGLKRVIFITAFLSLGFFETMAQNMEVTGQVTDQENEPLPGVTIVQKGETSKGTITNDEGNYSINVPEDATLVFSFIGMKTKEVQVNGRSVVNVSLTSSTVDMDQVVVTGYQSQRKADLTGAVSVVDVDEIKKVPSTNAMKSLQGKVPGMMVTTDGSPKGNATIRIRGIGTLNNNDPLYIIDGVPTKAGMHELNPNNIESIQVLKDAAAASIYGSRASNGVIVITTKKGKEGEMQVNFEASLTASWYSNKMDVLNTEQYGKAMWRAYVNSGRDPNSNNIGYNYDWGYNESGDAELNKILLPKYIDEARTMHVSDTDWFGEITRTSLMQSYDLSLSNGTEKGNYFFSLGYVDNEGIIKQSNFSRISSRLNSEYKLWDGVVTIGEHFTLNRTEELEAPGNILNDALQALPIIPVYTEDGEWGGPAGGMNDRHNPVRVLEYNKDNGYQYWRTFGDAYININPFPGLNIKSSFGIDYGNFYQRRLTRSYESGYLENDLTAANLAQGHWMKWNWSNTGTYNITLGNHKVDLLGGIEMFNEDNINFSAYKEGFELETKEYMWPDVGTGQSVASGSSTGYKLLSYFGKINYDYDGRYLGSFTLRHDGSSRFGENNQFGTFPAFSLGWRLSEEDFLIGNDNISNLKLRFGWGRTGNQEISNTAVYTIYIPDYGMADPTWSIVRGTAYDITGEGGNPLPSGFKLVQRGNDDLKWETTTQTNLGVDFGFFNQSVYGAAEYYMKETEDILVLPPYLGTIGEGGYRWVNGASMENKGFEATLGYRGETSSDGLSYDIKANVSAYKNKITYLPPDVQNAYGGDGEDDNILGRPINSMYGYVADGLFRTEEEVNSHAFQDGKGLGRIRYKDLNEDGVIDEEDRAWIGVPHPDFTYGLNINLGYRDFDLSVFVQGIQNMDANVHTRKANTDFWSVMETGSNKGTRLLNAWSPSNPDSDIPALQSTDANWEGRFSTYFVEDVSYLKIKNVQLGYTLPETITNKIRMSNLRFYVTGQNLLTFESKDFTGEDPETPGFGYPIPTTFTFGINASF